MKTIGLLGGMSWESTLEYYRLINQGVRTQLGGQHSAKIALYSVDFQTIEAQQRTGDWDGAASDLIDAARRVEAAGADCLLICTNTMHKVADQVSAAISIPLLHIADATGSKLQSSGVKKVGLLGTAFTMEQPFYKARLAEKFGMDMLVPDSESRALVHRIIYNELCQGKIESSSRDAFLRIMQQMSDSGAEAIILGCTEIGMLVNQQLPDVRLFDTTQIHAEAAVKFALS